MTTKALLLTLALPILPSFTDSVAAATIAVNCDAGGKLQTALNAAASGDTIQVTGVCRENISVRDELVRVTLDGQGVATIQATNAGATAIQVLGRNITIQRFTITGGRSGIGVLRGGSALIDGNTIQETAGTGILLHQNGHARIVNNTIQFNPNGGITVQENSMGRIGYLDAGGPMMGNVIRRNGIGVSVLRGGVASLTGNTISENDGAGVLVSGASHGDLAGNLIDANGEDGVVVTRNADVQLGEQPGILNPTNETTVPNGGYGLSCSQNASADGDLGTLVGTLGTRKFDSSCSNGQKIR